MRLQFSAFLLAISFHLVGQSYSLPKELNEISGIQFIDDTTLIALNDGGNENALFLLDNSGKIKKKVIVTNATNVDWEDITFNGNFVFIADIGNNLNNRKNLRIYRIGIEEIMSNESVTAAFMDIQYGEQQSFPPNKKQLNFDAECLVYAMGHLWIFTKNKTEPFDGISRVYKFKFQEGKSNKLSEFTTVNFGKRGWTLDAITAGDFAYDYFYLSTYNRVIKLELDGTKFKIVKEITYPNYNQKEALTVIKDDEIWVANEKHKILGKAQLRKVLLK